MQCADKLVARAEPPQQRPMRANERARCALRVECVPSVASDASRLSGAAHPLSGC